MRQPLPAVCLGPGWRPRCCCRPSASRPAPTCADSHWARPMQVTVIICTRNRADQLRRTLESAAAVDTPEHVSWELLVVDNGSTDHTPEVVESFSGRLPIRRVSEPEAGLSNARNRGVAEAKGDYICWTDDDVLIDP